MKREPTPDLTPREKQVIALLLQGEKRDTIAGALKIHVRTLDFHLENLRGKFGAGSLLMLAVRLVRTKAG